MAHTVESLSKLLRKTPDQVIAILTGAGISGKTAESNISADERQILMSSLSKRSSALNLLYLFLERRLSNLKRLPLQVVLRFKLKRSVRFLKTQPLQKLLMIAAILKAKQALEAGRLSEQKDEEHDAKRNDMVRQQKIKTEELQAQKIQNETAEKG